MRDFLRLLRRRILGTQVSGNPLSPPVKCAPEEEAVKALLAEGLRLSANHERGAALRQFERVLDIAPDFAAGYRHAGIEAFALGELDSARDYFVMAMHYQPQDVEAAIGLARVFLAVNDSARATDCLEKLLLRAPELSAAWFELACLQYAAGNFEEAVGNLRSGLQHSPNAAPLLNLLGLILARELGELDQGRKYLEHALVCAPEFFAAMSNLGWILAEQGHVGEAMGYFDQVLEAKPDDHETRLMRAYTNLKHGNFDEGWKDFSARHASPLALNKPSFPLPDLPEDADIAGERILIYAEQGLGDQIMFSSCIPDLLAVGGYCALECDAKLESLFRRSFPRCMVIPRSSQWEKDAPRLPIGELTYKLAMGSLPGLFRRRLCDYPVHEGYLRPDPDKVKRWRQRLSTMGPGPYVGISWKGGTRSTRRHLRSVPLFALKPIFECPGQFISLQYGKCTEEISGATAAGISIHHWSEVIDDYDETAALISALDLVISVCTAVVHLSGALGRPVWVMTPLTPEWRYMSSGDSLPWYPSAKLFRQAESNTWGDVIDNIALQLRGLAEN